MSLETVEDEKSEEYQKQEEDLKDGVDSLGGNMVGGMTQFSDSHSDACSSDSGKGGSEGAAATDIVNDSEPASVFPWQVSAYNGGTAYSESVDSVPSGQAMIYEFEIPQLIVGRLIGRFGTFVNKIKMTTGANIIVKRHNSCQSLKLCAVEGTGSEIEEALAMIRERFPEKRFPFLTLEQVDCLKPAPPPKPVISFLSPNSKLNLVEGVVNDVTLRCVTSLDSVFVQQPTHPTFPALARLRKQLAAFYEEAVDAPKLLQPFNLGVICVARGKGGEWFRAEVSSKNDELNLATVRLVDEGGYMEVPIEELRQIRFDFIAVPFQAVECKLFGVVSEDGSAKLTSAARTYFDKLCQAQILQAHIVGYSGPFHAPLIYLYRISENQVPILVNQELAEKGLAKWVGQPF